MDYRKKGAGTGQRSKFKHNYEKKEFQAAVKDIATNPVVTCKRLEKYINNHKTDISAQITYVRVLITLGRLEEAEMVLDNIEELLAEAKASGCINPEQLSQNEINYLVAKIRLLGFQGKYKDLYDLYKGNIPKVSGLTELDVALCWAKKQLGMDKHHKRSYKYNQIKHYSEAAFLEHIKKHLLSDDVASFLPSFPLFKIIEAIKKEVSSANAQALNYNFPYCKYVFKYPKCGKVRDREGKIWEVDYFVVVAHYGTENPEFITMCPARNDECSALPQVDLSYLAYEDEAPSSPLCLCLAHPNGGRKSFEERWGRK